MTTAAPNPRASLLSGLRTGGVRSASGPVSIPHTAAPTGTFNIPRITSTSYAGSHFPEEDGAPAQAVYSAPKRYQAPLTAAVDGSNNRFMQQQAMMAGVPAQAVHQSAMPVSPAFGGSPQAQAQAQMQAQALQMQMMQMEIMRLQNIQAQQYQADFLQAQRQQNVQNGARRMGFNPPATAGPLNTSFNVPAPAPDARRPPGTQFRTAHTAAPAEDQVPMTAALGGKFGTRLSSINTGRLSDDEDGERTPMTPTRVISGGPSLGAMAANGTGATPASPTTGPSKADGASTWRRGPVGASPLGAMRSVSPSVRITPPPSERVSPPPASAVGPRARPSPLQFNLAAAAPMLPAVSVAEAGEAEVEDEFSSSQSAGSSPVASDASSGTSLSPREEAAKRLYEGLGVGRPAPAVVAPVPVHPRVVSQAVRQPRGPPSGMDELTPKNFASRIRRKAIGGLNTLLDARERREIEAY